jgi:hypothetical protein
VIHAQAANYHPPLFGCAVANPADGSGASSPQRNNARLFVKAYQFLVLTSEASQREPAHALDLLAKRT